MTLSKGWVVVPGKIIIKLDRNFCSLGQSENSYAIVIPTNIINVTNIWMVVNNVIVIYKSIFNYIIDVKYQ